MRSFIISMVIAAVMATACIIYTPHLDKVSKSLIGEGEAASEYLMAEEFEKASEHIAVIDDYVTKHRASLAASLDHGELEKIESALAELKSYAALGEKEHALAKASALKLHLEHLPQNYKLKLENIL